MRAHDERFVPILNRDSHELGDVILELFLMLILRLVDHSISDHRQDVHSTHHRRLVRHAC